MNDAFWGIFRPLSTVYYRVETKNFLYGIFAWEIVFIYCKAVMQNKIWLIVKIRILQNFRENLVAPIPKWSEQYNNASMSIFSFSKLIIPMMHF